MRLSVALVVMAAALLVAASTVVHGGFYQLVSAGPESAYLVHRLTGRVWFIAGTTSHPVRAAPPETEKDFRK
ncbi:MAG: hypothetical protein QN131_06590 [Armatimonadota bacterium]|nr:hypothetical protein [Armatimonadota bacterium]MDR7549589.1 hypothetical protein [Armatimonadota bacterium]